MLLGKIIWRTWACECRKFLASEQLHRKGWQEGSRQRTDVRFLDYHFIILGKLYVPVQKRAIKSRKETSDGGLNSREVVWENREVLSSRATTTDPLVVLRSEQLHSLVMSWEQQSSSRDEIPLI